MRPSASLTASSSSPRRGTWRRRCFSIHGRLSARTRSISVRLVLCGTTSRTGSPQGASSRHRRVRSERRISTPSIQSETSRRSGVGERREKAGGENAEHGRPRRTPSRWRLRPPPPQAFRLALRLPRTTRRRGFNLEALRARCITNLRQSSSSCNAQLIKIPATSENIVAALVHLHQIATDGHVSTDRVAIPADRDSAAQPKVLALDAESGGAWVP